MIRREIRLQGLGGQGIISAGHLIGEAVSLYDHQEAIMTEDYSPYITGGWSRADIVISDEKIDYPLVSKPDILVAMSQDALDDNWQNMSSDSTIIVEAGLVDTSAVKACKVLTVPALSIAEELGKRVVANIVILGYLTQAIRMASRDGMERAIAARYPKAVELNRKAFDRGYELAKELA